MVLTDRGFPTEIAQFALGDLGFKVLTLHFSYSSALVKMLWDTRRAISTSVAICPISSPMSTIFSSVPYSLSQEDRPEVECPASVVGDREINMS